MSKSRNKAIDAHDEAYVRTWFIDLEILARTHGWEPAAIIRAIDEKRAPAPTYTLANGVRMVPPDYFALLGAPDEIDTLRERFNKRYVKAALAQAPTDTLLAEEWEGYISGGFGACLKDVSPESMFAKSKLIAAIKILLAAPDEKEMTWLLQLKDAVDALDALEKPFAAFDRAHYGGPVSRDLYITDVRKRFFEGSVGTDRTP